jgi:uncharacterized protein (DUF2252 family)
MAGAAVVDKPVRPVRRRTRATTPARVAPLATRSERVAVGKTARAEVPLESHAELDLRPGRDPLALLLAQGESRVQELVPVRHGRMMVSAFTFYRGAALPMAADLAGTPTSQLRVQLCGDAHLANFGAFASPERKLVFDLNDFDETLPGPFEWDVKRLAASFAVAGRDNDFSAKERRTCILEAVSSYRKAMRDFAEQPMMSVWYAHLDVEEALQSFKDQLKRKRFKATEAMLAKAHTRDSFQALNKLTAMVDGQRRILSNPPLIVPVEELFSNQRTQQINRQLHALVAAYRENLQSDRQHLLDQFQLVQVARKVVGVGSVGTRAWVLLMDGGDDVEPLFLQAKEAQASVLADFAGGSAYASEGQRVVAGQHLMQASSDIFLGWQSTKGVDGVERDYYLRQLRDWKVSIPIEQLRPTGLRLYASLCGWTLARAHARSGDRIALAAYLGRSHKFDHAIADFAEAYADLNELDHAQLTAAVAAGHVEAQSDL